MRHKKYLIIILVLWFAVSSFLPAYGEHKYITLDFVDETRNIIQGELAVILVTSIGIEPELPTAPLMDDYIKLLDRKGIRPLNGWNRNKMLTNGDFAVILVRAMGLEERLFPPEAIVKENRAYIQRMWELQYRQDGYRKNLSNLLTDGRFFPYGPPACPYGYNYLDTNEDYMVDAALIPSGQQELYPRIKYIFTLKRRGIKLEEFPDKILTLKAVKAALRSPIFRGIPPYVLIHDFKEIEEEKEVVVTPVTPGGP